MLPAATDVTGILATIDHALGAGDTSGDSMRWAPPTTSTVTFTWDGGDDGNWSAMFTGVGVSELESLKPGDGVWVNGTRFIIVSKIDCEDRGFEFELASA